MTERQNMTDRKQTDDRGGRRPTGFTFGSAMRVAPVSFAPPADKSEPQTDIAARKAS